MKRSKKLLKNQRGQGMLEYVLLLAIIAGLVMAFKGQIKTIFDTATGSLTKSTNNVFDSGN